jgi:diguanylate cyclase (GGDEF)-like protein
LEVAERIRQAIIEERVSGQTVTISIGVASIHGKDADAATLVKRADIALYKAKESRNTICVFV